MNRISRRSVLGLSAAATAGMVTGCAIGGSDEPIPGRDEPTGDGRRVIVPVADIPPGGSTVVNFDRRPTALSRTDDGQVVAFTAICTHQSCTVFAHDGVLRCPCHGSTFDRFTGEALGGPAREPLPRIEVAVDGTDVIALG